MMTYCAQDVRVNEKVYRTQLDWISKNQKCEWAHRYQICTTMVENGWGFDATAGEKLEQELMMDKAEALDQLRVVFPTIVEKRISEKTGKG